MSRLIGHDPRFDAPPHAEHPWVTEDARWPPPTPAVSPWAVVVALAVVTGTFVVMAAVYRQDRDRARAALERCEEVTRGQER